MVFSEIAKGFGTIIKNCLNRQKKNIYRVPCLNGHSGSHSRPQAAVFLGQGNGQLKIFFTNAALKTFSGQHPDGSDLPGKQGVGISIHMYRTGLANSYLVEINFTNPGLDNHG